MIDILGVTISAIDLMITLREKYADSKKWNEKELITNPNWLKIAIQKGIVNGKESDFRWTKIAKVPERELSEEYATVGAEDIKTKTRYKILWGPEHDRLVLMRRIKI